MPTGFTALIRSGSAMAKATALTIPMSCHVLRRRYARKLSCGARTDDASRRVGSAMAKTIVGIIQTSLKNTVVSTMQL